MYRRFFENGPVLLNSSAITPFAFDLNTLFPGKPCRRIRGKQDPVHNSGESTGDELTLGPRNGILLRRCRSDRHTSGNAQRPWRQEQATAAQIRVWAAPDE